MAKMTATWIDGMRFAYDNGAGHGLLTDAPVESGGLGTAVSPMQLVILGLIGCTGVDVAVVLKKMRQPLEGLEVSAEYERADSHPKVYTKIHLKYVLKGDLQEKKVQRAIRLSEESLCSVTAMLEKTAKITSEYELLGPS